ncbi:hypothetical protein SAMN05216553_113179 [Lentzea fradiae]|uniref:Uncharacterized protein n=1 Tax=Lentzea fradiae TaxID=200378 RepID=A0A1G7YAB9_9PSEU|nr:hypothetical protein [Lentzea fradiae]SDG93303.1 hypothetical protein SAMN05216553_113179 [Lentzea fradiae]
MNEEDLRKAFRDVVASSPPPMDPGAALGAAHKARSRRRASVAGAVVAVLVAGIGLGAAFAVDPGGTRELLLASPSSSSSGRWPAGQTDATPTSGPHADRAAQLLVALTASAREAGFETSELNQLAEAHLDSSPDKSPQVWVYRVRVPVRKDGGVGVLLAEVSTPRPGEPEDPCVFANRSQGHTGAGGCKTYDVGGKQVGTAASTSIDQPASTTASYRAAGGWTVTVTQREDDPGSGHPKLDAQPFFTPALAALAADPKLLPGG